MFTNDYPREIQEHIRSLTAHYTFDFEHNKISLAAIEAYMAEHSDPSLDGFVHFIHAKLALMHQRDIKAYREHLLQAIALLQNEDDADILASCYNLIGVECLEYCNYDLAVSHFLTALRVLEPLHADPMAAVVSSNLGMLYAAIGDFHTALSYTQKMLHMVEQLSPAARDCDVYLAGICLNGWYALEVQDMSAARSSYDKLW